MINGAKPHVPNCILNATNDSSVQESLPETAGVRFISLDGNHLKCIYINQMKWILSTCPSQWGEIIALERNSFAVDIRIRR